MNPAKNANMEDEQEIEYLRKLFIGGLHPRTKVETLEEYFSKFGKVTEAKVMKDETGKTRGFGFITYERAAMVDRAQEARPHEIDGKAVESKRLVPRTDIDKPESKITVKKLFVGGVRNEHDEASLRKYFSKFGNVVNLNIAVDPKSGRRKGYAFVEYDDYDSVDKIVIQKLHFLKGVPLDVKKALTRQMAEKIARTDGRGPPRNMLPNNPQQSNLMNTMNNLQPVNIMQEMNGMQHMNGMQQMNDMNSMSTMNSMQTMNSMAGMGRVNGMQSMNALEPMNTSPTGSIVQPMHHMNNMNAMNASMYQGRGQYNGNWNDGMVHGGNNWNNATSNHIWNNPQPQGWHQNQSTPLLPITDNYSLQQNRRALQNNRMNPYQSKKGYSDAYSNPISVGGTRRRN